MSPISRMRSCPSTVNGTAFSPDGSLLAVLTVEGQLRILDIGDIDNPILRINRSTPNSLDVGFIDNNLISVALHDAIEFVALNGASERFSLEGVRKWTTNPGTHQIAFALRSGQAVVVEGLPVRVIARATLCTAQVTNMAYVPLRQMIAYACRDGSVGVWDPRTNSLRQLAQFESPVRYIICNSTGEYIMVAGSTGTMSIIDLATDLVIAYKGHGSGITAMAGSSPQPYVISADNRGTIRAWPIPLRIMRVITRANFSFLESAIVDNDTIMTTAQTTELTA